MEKNWFLLMVIGLSHSLEAVPLNRHPKNPVAKDVHELKEAEDIVWILRIPSSVSRKKPMVTSDLEKKASAERWLHYETAWRQNPMAAIWKANWGKGNNTENQQFHGEEHHDQCEHLDRPGCFQIAWPNYI